MEDNTIINIAYSGDENYVQHMGVSIFSLCQNNRTVKEINIYILANNISGASRKKLIDIVEAQFKRKLVFIDFKPFGDIMRLNMEWPISLSAYARLFLPEMLPESCKRVLYIDVICGSLMDLWNTELGCCSVGGVLDTVLPSFKTAIGLKSEDKYINSSVLLIDLEKWRDNKIQKKFIQFLEEHDGRVSHHDQGIINGVLHDSIYILNCKYNAMTPIFTTKYKNLFELYHLTIGYYSREDCLYAKRHPVIIHFVEEFVGRVWERGCHHPKRKLYQKYLRCTVWRNNLISGKKQSWKKRVIYWMYCRLPVTLLKLIGIWERME